MQEKLKKLTTQLVALSECADNPKLLFEEIQVIQEKAFNLQDQLMSLLDQIENETKDIAMLQNVFQIRENVWDIMNKLADKEREIKSTKDKKAPHKKGSAETCHCGCHHHDEKCCCGHHHESCKEKGKTCKKK